jgi:hypothetical protein
MTTYGSEEQTCSVCGACVECTTLNSVTTFGSPDLDLRPSETRRSTMDNWLHECTECGYINSNLKHPIEDAKRIIESDPYTAIGSDSQLPRLALLSAAWVCDDRKNSEQAKSYRDQAADILLAPQPGPYSTPIFVQILCKWK